MEYRKSLTINPGLYFLWGLIQGGGGLQYIRGAELIHGQSFVLTSIINKSVINRKINM
jgi:hypothetical protein